MNNKDYIIKDLCNYLGIPDLGYRRVQHIRESKPSRRVQSNGRNVCVRYPSKKMGVVIQAESHTVELPYIYQLEHDDSVIEFYDQPTSIKLSYKTNNGRNLGVIHTPDFFVISENYIGYTECKTEEELERLAIKQPNRYLRSDDGIWICPPGEEAAAEVGLSYRVWSDKQVNWTLQSNLIFLDDYMRNDYIEVEEEQIDKIKQALTNNKAMSIHELVSIDGIDADSIYKLIIKEKIYFNLESMKLSDSHSTNIFLNKTYALAYDRLHPSEVKDSLYTTTTIKTESGEHVLWDGVKWKILNVGQTQIVLSSVDGKTIPLSILNFEQMINEGLIKAELKLKDSIIDKKRLSLISSASENDLEIANHRFKTIQPILNGSENIIAIKEYAQRTLFRWISSYKKADLELGQGYLGLIPKNKEKGNINLKIPEESITLMDEVIKTKYEDKKQITIKMAYDRLRLKCQEKGVICPSDKTFRRRIKTMPKEEQVKKREGKRAASNLAVHYWNLERETPKHGERSFEIAHIDHTELDIELISRDTGSNLGRPWLTLMVDTYTRRIIAFYLTFDPPSYKSCMMVLRECVRRNERLPQTIIVDNGKEFGSTAFETLLASYEIIKKSRPPAKSRFGSVCERMFGTTNKELIYGLAGNTQITKKVRIMTKSVNPKNLALWNISSLTTLLGEFLYNIYDSDVHPALHDSPKHTHTKSIELHGERINMHIPYTEDFKIRTLPSTHKGTSRVNFTTGIQLNYIHYWHESFRNSGVEGTNVPVKYDPIDAGIAYAYVNKRWVQCTSEYYSVFKRRPWKEVSDATIELRQKNKNVRKSKYINAHSIAVFLQAAEENEAVLEEKKRNKELSKPPKPDIKLVESDAYPDVVNKIINEHQYENSNDVAIMDDF